MIEGVVPRRRLAGSQLVLAAAILAAVAGGVPLVYELAHSRSQAAPRAAPMVSATGLLARSGVRVVRVAVTGGGGLVDLRYQVVDADRAQAVHDPATPPLLVDERTAGVVDQFLMGHNHAGTPKAGVTYYLIFVNPGRLVRRGSLVSVRLGDARLAHVRVQ